MYIWDLRPTELSTIKQFSSTLRSHFKQEAKALREAGIRARKEQRLAKEEAKEAAQMAKRAAQEAKRQSMAVKKGRKRDIGQVIEAGQATQAKKVKVVSCTTLRGRAIARPQRYN
jgi:hypothetical protein